MRFTIPGKLRKQLYLAFPLVAALVFSLFTLLPFFGNFERQLYDSFLKVRPAPPMSDLVRLVDVDDEAVARVGSWPWPRNLMADGILAMREAGVRAVLFDIEYPTRSPAGVDIAYLDRVLPAAFRRSFGGLAGDAADLVDAVASGALPPKAAREYAEELKTYSEQVRDQLFSQVRSIARDNDDYLGKAARLAGNAYFALNMNDDPEAVDKAPPDSYAAAKARFEPGSLRSRAGLIGPIPQVAAAAKGLGFVNVVVDADGKRRRIELAQEAGGKAYLQLVMRPLVDILGDPGIEIRKGETLLRGATLPDGRLRDIAIPTGADSTMSIAWPKENYGESFKHESFYSLVNLGLLEDDLAATLGAIAGLDISYGEGVPAHRAGSQGALDLLSQAEELKRAAMESGLPEDVEAWISARAAWFDAAAGFLAGDTDEILKARIDLALAAGALTDEDIANAKAMRQGIDSFYRMARDASKILGEERARIAKSLGGKLCILGWTSTGTTDLGVNPFHKEYVNVGTHAAVANTILNLDFIREAPLWVSWIAALAFSLAAILVAHRFGAAGSAAVGFVGAVVVVVIALVIFVTSGVYVSILAPTLATLFAPLAWSIVKYLGTAKEKSFIQKAFSTYLSPAVIDEIINDPSKLNLGGQKRLMTAIFTDIRGFSTVSEKLDPAQLVALLNEYLTGMSDIVLDGMGTIDKYEGDAIIAFFGAPVVMQDHAARALHAAVLMKRKEAEMNKSFMDRGLAPNPLLTRIGINTGEMVVGNMGTNRKMDYTIMGNAVNLAARLEGVNKQYGTWILASDEAANAAGPGFLSRRLDRVRVVGIKTPVQLWEIVDIASEATADDKARVEAFHEGLDLFEARDWKRSSEAFATMLERWPEDSPAKLYGRRAADFAGPKPPASDYDGIINLSEK